MATPKVYVLCDQNCKFESMTKEQIYTAIMQAVNDGNIGDIDTGFITTIKTITGQPLRFFVGEKSAYDLLSDDAKKNLFAIITNDTEKEGINGRLNLLEEMQKGYTKTLESLFKTMAEYNASLNNIKSTYSQKITADYPVGSIVPVVISSAREPLDEIDVYYFTDRCEFHAWAYDAELQEGRKQKLGNKWRVCGRLYTTTEVVISGGETDTMEVYLAQRIS